jgi:large subunit ribosomal protein L15
MKLNEISDNEGARRKFKRVGRGIASGKGKTAGRGVKGQKARSGVTGIRQFEGGQMPLYMRMPKRGFNKPNRLAFVEINLGRIQAAIDAGKLDAGAKIDGATLVKAGVIRRALDGVRLLGTGELKARLDITVAHASAGAKAAVEKAGGKVVETIVRTAEEPKKDTAKADKKADKKGSKKAKPADDEN